MTADALVRGTIWLALVCYFTVLVLRLSNVRSTRWQWAAKLIWTVGALLLGGHMVAAFHYHHHWSHRLAYDETAEKTARLLGVPWGGGIYFNYVFLLIWIADCLAWWIIADVPWKSAVLVRRTVDAFMFLIVFNAVVVFEEGLLRGIGLLACLVLLLLLTRRLVGKTEPSLG